jgi:DNA-binding LacI/PurR family transcriptional regulator
MKVKENSTIAEIARRCGVSAMTVSRALRRNSPVKAETRRGILETAEKMGYIKTPRFGAAGAGAGKPALKVQIIAGASGKGMALFHSELITALEQNLSARGCECVIKTYSGDYTRFVQIMDSLRGSADPVIITGSFETERLAALLAAAPGALLLDHPGDPSIETAYSSIAFDNAEAGRIGARHLLDSGAGRVLLVNGAEGHFFSREFELGYREALISRKTAADENLIFHTDFTAGGAQKAVSGALESGLKFDAVLTNDEMASGVYRALLDRGLKIPGDIRICGCDGLPVGAHLYPRLTTVSLDYAELGRMAAGRLPDSIDAPPCRIRLLPKLQIRESSKI